MQQPDHSLVTNRVLMQPGLNDDASSQFANLLNSFGTATAEATWKVRWKKTKNSLLIFFCLGTNLFAVFYFWNSFMASSYYEIKKEYKIIYIAIKRGENVVTVPQKEYFTLFPVAPKVICLELFLCSKQRSQIANLKKFAHQRSIDWRTLLFLAPINNSISLFSLKVK